MFLLILIANELNKLVLNKLEKIVSRIFIFLLV